MGTLWTNNKPCPFSIFDTRARTLNATGTIHIRGWGDPTPIYTITFKNGVKFQSCDEDKAFNEARAYAFTVHRLTGEWP